MVVRRPVSRRRDYGADLVLPPGRTARLVAPFPGIVRAHSRGDGVRPGQHVRRGDPLIGLQPVLTEPDKLRLAEVQLTLAASRADALAQLRRAEAAVRLARVQAERGSRLLRSDAGSQKAVDEARAALATAEANLAAARLRHDLYADAALAPPGSIPVTGLEAPLDGVVRDLPVVPGQTVSSGAELAEVADLSVLWARVPVPVQEASSIEDGPARLHPGEAGAGRGGTGEVVARLVAAPPTASATSASVDRYYEVRNEGFRLAPGTRLVASLPLSGRSAYLVVPWSAVVLDVNGGSWVYACPRAHTFTRVRVSVERVEQDLSLLSAGPSPGTTIAVTGVAELFGVDVGFAK